MPSIPRLLGLFGALAASASAVVLRSAKDTPIPPIYPIGVKNASFARAVGTLFEIDDRVQYFSGCNAWWLGKLTKNEDVNAAMKYIADTKYKIIRVWGFGEVDEIPRAGRSAGDPLDVWFQYLNKTGSYINYGDDGLQRLDYVVSTAEKLGLKLVLPFINNWSVGGGINLYTNVYGFRPGFYRNKKAQEVYRDWIRILVERYKNSPAIFSWQLGNEPRCAGGDCDENVLWRWVNDTSHYIKSLDPHHMVSMGDEGWFAPASGYADHHNQTTIAYMANSDVNFVANLNITTIDYGTFHLYTSTWGYDFDWGHLWIKQHVDAGRKQNKPVALEEYGSPNKADHTMLAKWQETILKENVATDQLWQFGPGPLPSGLNREGLDLGEGYIVYYDTPEYELLARKQAQAMLDKKVPSI